MQLQHLEYGWSKCVTLHVTLAPPRKGGTRPRVLVRELTEETDDLWVIKPKSNAAPRVCTSHDEEA